MMPRSLPIPLLLAASLLGACRAADFDFDPDASDTAIESDTGFDPSDTDDDVADSGVPTPTWWSISGQLEVVDGQVSKLGSQIVLSVIGDDGVADPPLCLSVPELLSAAPTPVQGDGLAIWGWWTVTLANPFPDCAPQSFVDSHTSFVVGIGELDPLLNPALDADGLDYTTASQTLYGLYVQEVVDGPVYIFGIAGTTDNFSGDAGTVSTGPLPDGEYELQTLHLLPL